MGRLVTNGVNGTQGGPIYEIESKKQGGNRHESYEKLQRQHGKLQEE